MSELYLIKPVDKKSIEYFMDVYRINADESISGWTVTETYRWGQGFRDLDDPVWDYEKDHVRCNPGIGWGAELDDCCARFFEWTDDISQEERDYIELMFEVGDNEGRFGSGWVFDGEHDWQVEEDCVYVIGPVKIDLVDETTYNTIEENVPPYEDDKPGGSNIKLTEWPFPTPEK